MNTLQKRYADIPDGALRYMLAIEAVPAMTLERPPA